jgi:multiple sugar transport system permease protein
LYSLQKALSYFVLYKPQAERFIGLENFASLITSDYTQTAFFNTLAFTAVTVSAEMVLGFALALVLSRWIYGQGVLRTLLMVPVLLSPIIVGLSWRFMYNPNIGIFNQLLNMMSVAGPHWLENPTIAFWAVMIPEIWQWTPFVALVFLAGLQGIAPDIQEAALLDGLRLRHLVRYIYIPMVMPIAVIVLLLRVIDAMKAFDIVYILTQGGPGLATMLVSIRAWTLALIELNFGQAAALSFMILLLVSAFTVVFLKLLGRRTA